MNHREWECLVGYVTKVHEVWPVETHYQRLFSNIFFLYISPWFLRVQNTWFFSSFKNIPVRIWVTSILWNKPWYEERFRTWAIRGEEHEWEPEVLEREVLPDVPQWTIEHLVRLRAEGSRANTSRPQLLSAYGDLARCRVWALPISSHLALTWRWQVLLDTLGFPLMVSHQHRRRQSRPELPCILSLYLHVWGFSYLPSSLAKILNEKF